MNAPLLKLILKNKKLVIFGTGSSSKHIVGEFGLKPQYFVDNNSEKWNSTFFGAAVYNPSILEKENRDRIFIIVASIYYNEISAQLKALGFEEFTHFISGIEWLQEEHVEYSYAQEGEDMVLKELFPRTKNGFYVDVGAHHPYRFSNTYWFYKRGWRGINIDPIPGMKETFDKERPRDINLEIGISNKNGSMTYYIFEEMALNTLNEQIAMNRINNRHNLVGKKLIELYRLDNIFEKYGVQKHQIDFITIDVEGHELEVLQSNNWEYYRPKYILIEQLESTLTLDTESSSPVKKFLESVHYAPFAKTIRTWFYKDLS